MAAWDAVIAFRYGTNLALGRNRLVDMDRLSFVTF